MKKRARIQVRPKFTPKIDLKEAIGREIARRAEIADRNYRKHPKKSYQRYQRGHPKVCKSIRDTLVGQHGKTAKKNTSEFFCYLYAALFGGKVNEPEFDGFSQFHPDVTDESDMRVIHTEVKGVSKRQGAPMITFTQFSNYCADFYKMANNGTEVCGVDYAFFRYGDSQTNEKLYQYSHTGLAKRLSESIHDLLIIPLNVLIPFLMSHQVREFNHGSSTSGRDAELYWTPWGGDITKIHKGHERVEDLFESADESGILWDDLCADNLEREEFMSPGNVYCGRYKVRPFHVTKYHNVEPREWARAFIDVSEEVFAYFGISPSLLREKFEKTVEDVEIPF